MNKNPTTTMEEEATYEPQTPSSCSERQSVASPLPPSVSRLWRPAAQRNLRNQWSKLSSLRRQWTTSSSACRSLATSLVNAHLSLRYVPLMELGVLSDMPGIRSKASLKLLKQQELHRSNLLSSYKGMASIVTELVKTSKSMRCYLKGAISSSRIQFSGSSEDTSDLGDGGGMPVFKFLSISCFEKFADELVQQHILELNLKRLLVVEFLSVSCEPSKLNQFNWSDELYSGEFYDLRVCKSYCEENSEPIFLQNKVSKFNVPIAQCNPQPTPETLQVYLTTWIAEVNIDPYRVDEIFSMLGEEMHVKF